jgi:ArsR family transcriptional regulator
MSGAITQLNPDSTESDSFADTASLLKAMADPLRLEILRVLARGSYGVLELCNILDCKQPALSHHLKVLASADIVATRREGNSIYYRRAHLPSDNPHQSLQHSLFTDIDCLALSEPVQQRLKLVQRERADASQQFFALNAHKFREQQDLIASFPVYADQVRDLLKKVCGKKHKSVVEVGPGEGELLPLLVQQFTSVVALDNSATMLDKAQSLAKEKNLKEIQFFLGDTQILSSESIHADCIVMNMVLHHTPEPADIFFDVAQALNPNGILLVTDLCSHQQQWAKDNCGDLWLGFEPLDFTEWARAAGLTEGQSEYFALRNGFQVQIRQFKKVNGEL